MTTADGGRAPANQVRGGSLLLGGRVVAVGINLATQVLVIRYLTSADYGALALVISLTWVARNFSTLGLHRVLPRLLPEYHESHDYKHLFGAIALQAGTILITGLALWTAVLLANLMGHPIFRDEPGRSLALIMALIVPLEALDYFLFETIMAVFNRPKMIAVRKHIAGPLIKLGVVILMIALGASVQFLAAGLVVAAALGIALYLPLVFRAFGELGLRTHFKDGIRIPWEALAIGIPLLTTDVMFAARSSLDAILVQSDHGFTAVAELRAVQPAANLNALVTANFAILFMPLAARLMARRSDDDLNEVYWTTAAWQTALTFPFFVATFSLATITTLVLAGEQYRSSAPILAVLAVGFFVSAAEGPSDLILAAGGRVRYIVAGNFLVAAFNVALLLLLVPPLGPMGAAVATTASLIAQCAYQHLGLRGSGVRLTHSGNLALFLKVSAAAAGLLAFDQIVHPHAVIMIAAAGVIVLLTLRLNRQVLAVQHTFPELMRVPWARQLVGISTDPGANKLRRDEVAK